MSDLEDFHRELIADIQGDADVLGLVTVEAFFEKVGDLLTEAGEIDEANRAFFEGTYSRGGLQIDGYGGDPRDSDGHWCRDKISTFCIYATGIENNLIDPACRTNITPPAAITSVR